MTRVSRDLVPGRVGRVLAWACAAALALAGCSGASGGRDDASGDAQATPEAAPLLTGGVEFPRTLQADRWVEVQLDGSGKEGWFVTGAALVTGMFEPLAPTPEHVKLRDDHVARVRVPLGATTCPATSDARVDLALLSPNGARADASVALPADVLAGINADECAVKAVTDAATPALGEPTSSDGTAVTTTLTLARGTLPVTQAAAVTDGRGSVIFTLSPAPGASYPLTLQGGDASVVMPVVLDATRCDQHAFAESKKTFVFAVWVSLDGAEPAYVELRPSPALKDALQAAFDTCGDESSRDAPGGD